MIDETASRTRACRLIPDIAVYKRLSGLSLAICLGVVLDLAPAVIVGQQAQPHAGKSRSDLPAPKSWTAAQDHQQMMEQLGIQALRPGPSGNEQDPNHANYDEEKANPFPVLPEPLRFRNGQRVTSARQWPRRRTEIVEDFEREVYGRIPPNVPKVAWTITA